MLKTIACVLLTLILICTAIFCVIASYRLHWTWILLGIVSIAGVVAIFIKMG